MIRGLFILKLASAVQLGDDDLEAAVLSEIHETARVPSGQKTQAMIDKISTNLPFRFRLGGRSLVVVPWWSTERPTFVSILGRG